MASKRPNEGRLRLVALEPEAPEKKPRRTFPTKEERQAATKERKKRHDQSRIALGKNQAEFNRQKLLCGLSNSDFIGHLLALHRSHCPTYVTSRSDLQAIPNSERSTDTPGRVEYVCETPDGKRGVIDCDSELSPEIPSYKQGGSVWKELNCSTPLTHPVELGHVCSTPLNDHGMATKLPTIIPNEVVEVLTPIKPAAARRLPLVKTPQLFEGSYPTDEQEVEMEEGLPGVTDIQFPSDDNCLEGVPVPQTNYKKLRVQMTPENSVSVGKCIAFNDVLETLLRAAIGSACRTCKTKLLFEHKKYGTCLVIKWFCPVSSKGHTKGTWCSQPRIHGMYAGNILTSTALALSGNNYTKVALLAKFLNLNFVTETMFYCTQRRYIAPAVNMYWERHQMQVLRSLKGKRIVIGDGRNDSPGHNSQFLTYTIIDYASGKIIAIVVIDCRFTELNSVVMERLGFKRAMAQVLEKIDIAEVVTDGHPQIRKLMRTDPRYANITHQWDVWHVAKGMAKKLVAAGKEKGMQDLLPWVPAIKNHLWYSARTCEGNADKLRMNWQSVVNHVSNRHEWLDKTGLTAGRCQHQLPLPEEDRSKAWLKPGSPVQKRLYNLVHNKTFNKQLSYLRNFRHTGGLELFHSHMLMYAPKRMSFKFSGHKMRSQLSGLDFNHHCDRLIAVDKDGNERNVSHWSKVSKRWAAYPVKELKTYLYIPEIFRAVLKIRENEAGHIRMNQPVPLEDDDPRIIAPNIAPVPKPPIEELLAQQKSRFGKE